MRLDVFHSVVCVSYLLSTTSSGKRRTASQFFLCLARKEPNTQWGKDETGYCAI